MAELQLKDALVETLGREYDDQYNACTEEHIFSHKFEKEMAKLIKRHRKPYYRMINTAGKRVACIAIAIFAAMTATVLSVDALRNAFKIFFVNIFDDYSVVQVEGLENAPDTIEAVYDLTCDLSGYTVDLDELTENVRNKIYYNGESEIEILQFTADSYMQHINTENATIEKFDDNNTEYMWYMDNHEFGHLIFVKDGYVFMVEAKTDKNRLLSIAKSVEKVK